MSKSDLALAQDVEFLLGRKLAGEYGRGFEVKNLYRMVQFAQTFPDLEKGATLSRRLSWSHFLLLIPLKIEAARWYYAEQSIAQSWSVRELRRQIERKSYDHSQIANPESPEVTSAGIFKDPYFLDFLGLRDGYDEADLGGSDSA